MKTPLTLALVCAILLPSAFARVVMPLSGPNWTFDGEPVAVPHTWNARDAADGLNTVTENPGTSVGSPSYVRGAHTYARALPKPRVGKRYFIRCEGVSSKALVRVNDKDAGTHAGAFTAFCFEITDLLSATDNRLEIIADNSYDRDLPPISGDFSMFGGVYRDVWLIETDKACISPLVDGGPGVVLEPNPLTGEITARVTVDGGTNEVQHFRIKDFECWSPETPKVYPVRISIRQDGGCDEIVETVGFRTVESRRDGFYLNGVKRQIRGVCRHQDRDGKGWAVSAADEEEDVVWLKRMGADGVRTAHYPHSSHFFDVCDQKGIMVWTEIPVIDEVSFSAAFLTNMMTVAREMVAQHRHHPSIVMWGLYNELFGEGGATMPEDEVVALMRKPLALLHAMDATRPVTSATCDASRRSLNALTDLQGFNLYPGWYNWKPWYEGVGGWDLSNAVKRVLATMPMRQVVAVSEYGGGASITQQEDPMMPAGPIMGSKAFYPEGYQAYLHWGALASVQDNPKVWGIFPWVMFDLAADRRREADRWGINNKGLVTYDRRVAKDAFFLYKANWNPEPELHLVGTRMTATTNATVNVMVFSNVGSVTLKVNGRVVSTVLPDRVKTCLWRDVPLGLGDNDIEVVAGALKENAHWTRK